MLCPNCNSNNPDGTKFCSNCGTPLQPVSNIPPQQLNYNPNQKPPKVPFYKKTWLIVLACIFLPPVGIALMWIAGKPKKKVLRIILTVILAFYTIGLFGSSASKKAEPIDSTVQQVQKDDEQNVDPDDAEPEETEPVEEEPKEEVVPEEPTISPEEYKAQCQEVSYSDMMRNPDAYIGQKIKITVKIFSASHKWTAGTYYKAYTDDGNGYYFDKMVWVFDKRDEDADDYVKVLEDDIVTFYGEFNGLQETKNALNGEKGEDLALDAYYVDIVQPAE